MSDDGRRATLAISNLALIEQGGWPAHDAPTLHPHALGMIWLPGGIDSVEDLRESLVRQFRERVSKRLSHYIPASQQVASERVHDLEPVLGSTRDRDRNGDAGHDLRDSLADGFFAQQAHAVGDVADEKDCTALDGRTRDGMPGVEGRIEHLESTAQSPLHSAIDRLGGFARTGFL